MSRTSYVNGRYVPHGQAVVHVEDRGFQFADAVYEVIYLHEGRLIDRDLHLDRLDRSLRELQIRPPLGRAALLAVLAELMARNRPTSGLIYMQITRGRARRDFYFPPAGTRPTLVVTMRRAAALPKSLESWTAGAITLPDQRWARRDIKSVGLLANVLARQAAREAGALEAIMYDEADMVTEGASTSVWIVDSSGILRTRPLSNAILPGCTRAALIMELAAAGIPLQERAVSMAELRAAREIFLTAATTFVRPVLVLDGSPVGDGAIGPVATQMFGILVGHVRGTALGLPDGYPASNLHESVLV